MKPILMYLMNWYELNGSVSGNRSEEKYDWGTFDIILCARSDYQKGFLRKRATNSQSYLLYWWLLLDNEGLVQSTCVKLYQCMVTHSCSYSLVSCENINKVNNTTSEASNQTEKNIETIVHGVSCLSEVTVHREVEAWEENTFDLEFKILKLNEICDANKILLIKKRMKALDKNYLSIKC